MSTGSGSTPQKAMTIKSTVSNSWPTSVDPIVRDHKYFPFVAIFNFARTNEFKNSPTKYAIILAATIRGVSPRMALYASWLGQSEAGGSAPTIIKMTAMRTLQPNPIHITLLALENPYTSVKISPKIYAKGKRIVPASNVKKPKEVIFEDAIFEIRRIATKSAVIISI